MFWFFGHEACGILAPRPGIEPASPALEGEVLTTGPPGKSQMRWYLSWALVGKEVGVHYTENKDFMKIICGRKDLRIIHICHICFGRSGNSYIYSSSFSEHKMWIVMP